MRNWLLVVLLGLVAVGLPLVAVGKAVAERALEAGVKAVAFDRSGFKYHGRIQQLAEAARESGLQF